MNKQNTELMNLLQTKTLLLNELNDNFLKLFLQNGQLKTSIENQSQFFKEYFNKHKINQFLNDFVILSMKSEFDNYQQQQHDGDDDETNLTINELDHSQNIHCEYIDEHDTSIDKPSALINKCTVEYLDKYEESYDEDQCNQIIELNSSKFNQIELTERIYIIFRYQFES